MPNLHQFPLQQIAQQLDIFLSSALLDARKDFGAINSPSHIAVVIQKATERFIADYERLDEILFAGAEDDEGGVQKVWPRTVEEVRVLLS